MLPKGNLPMATLTDYRPTHFIGGKPASGNYWMDSITFTIVSCSVRECF